MGTSCAGTRGMKVPLWTITGAPSFLLLLDVTATLFPALIPIFHRTVPTIRSWCITKYLQVIPSKGDRFTGCRSWDPTRMFVYRPSFNSTFTFSIVHDILVTSIFLVPPTRLYRHRELLPSASRSLTYHLYLRVKWVDQVTPTERYRPADQRVKYHCRLWF